MQHVISKQSGCCLRCGQAEYSEDGRVNRGECEETTGRMVKYPSEPTCARCGEPLANCTCAAAEILGAVVEALDELDQHPQTDLHLASCASCMLAHDKALPDGGVR
jgi:hypothetical protein